MPHDRKGQELSVGDEVVVPGKITSIQPNPDYCNVTVETVELMPGITSHTTTVSLNSKQVEKLIPPDQKGKVPGPRSPVQGQGQQQQQQQPSPPGSPLKPPISAPSLTPTSGPEPKKGEGI